MPPLWWVCPYCKQQRNRSNSANKISLHFRRSLEGYCFIKRMYKDKVKVITDKVLIADKTYDLNEL